MLFRSAIVPQEIMEKLKRVFVINDELGDFHLNKTYNDNEEIIGIVSDDSKFIIEDGFIWGDVALCEDKEYEWVNTELLGNFDEDDNFVINAISAIQFKEIE